MITFIGPWDEDFTVYGGADVVERAKWWAAENHYLLVQGVAPCVHGLWAMDACPGGWCTRNYGRLDHENIWVEDNGHGLVRPFLLAHVYGDDETMTLMYDDVAKFAGCAGVSIASWGGWVHNWYDERTFAVMLDLTQAYTVTPLEREAILHSVTRPARWSVTTQ